MKLLRCCALLLSVLITASAPAQERLQSPGEFLGYELGEWFTPHHRVAEYVRHVAAASPNVRLEQYGTTYEGRPLLAAFVSAPENLARLEEIRTNNLRLAGMAAGQGSEDAPALVWLGYGVHGNESSSTEAAMATLYDLANPENGRTQGWLRDAVVVIDPCLNPDGRERYVQWFTQTAGRFANPRPAAREHREPWPYGRTNHYYFDLNRDWSWGTQQEVRQRVALYQRWMPHVYADFHEQHPEEPYYFAPAAEPFHEAITPWQRAFQTLIGRNHARYFDQAGLLYFTRERFDLFYPGYGDTWPTFNGAIGMTYEQGGGGRGGLGIILSEGDTLTLAERIRNHHTTGLSTVETAVRERQRLVSEFARYFREALAEPAGPYEAFVVKAGTSPGRLDALTDLLDRQGIRYGYSGGGRSVNGVAYGTNERRRVDVEPGDLIVSLYQPRSALARVLFDPQPVLSDSVTYDATAWALPYVYGLEAYALTERLEGSAQRPPGAPDGAAGSARPYAYLAERNDAKDVRLLAALLRRGVKVRSAARPFEVEGRSYGAGTLIVTRTGNEALGERFDPVVRAVADSLGQAVQGVATGMVTKGADFGSDDVAYVSRPEVAVLSGRQIYPNALGEVWHYFDEQIGYPATLIDAADLGQALTPDYDVLILPAGSYGEILTDARLEDLRDWIRQGGRLVAMEEAVGALAGKEGFAVKRREAKPAAGADSLEARLRSYGERERREASESVPGSIYRVRMDPTHPLAYGYGDTYYTFKTSAAAFDFLADAWNVGVIREGTPVSGFAGAQTRARLTDTLVFGVQEMGQGSVVYLVDDPLFRGFWYNGRLLFGNAVFMGR